MLCSWVFGFFFVFLKKNKNKNKIQAQTQLNSSRPATHACSKGEQVFATCLVLLFADAWLTKQGCSSLSGSLLLPVGAVDHWQVRVHMRISLPLMLFSLKASGAWRDFTFKMRLSNCMSKRERNIYFMYLELTDTVTICLFCNLSVSSGVQHRCIILTKINTVHK